MFLFVMFNTFVIVNSFVAVLHSKSSEYTPGRKSINNLSSTDFGSKVTLLRHANTYNNQNKIWTGQLDNQILDTNHKKIKIYDYDLVLSSSATRCKQTMDLLEFNNRPEIIFDDCFLEAGYGDLTGKVKDDNLFVRKFFNYPPKSSYYKSESIFEAGLRSYLSFSYYYDKLSYKNSKVLVLSHKNTLKGLWAFLNLDYMLYQEDKILDEDSFDQLEYNIQQIIEDKKIPNFENLNPYDIEF